MFGFPISPGALALLRWSVSFSSSSYNPYDGPNEHPEAELPLVAGKYLYVYGTMDDDGFYDGLIYEIHIYIYTMFNFKMDKYKILNMCKIWFRFFSFMWKSA